jgi:MFS family permease
VYNYCKKLKLKGTMQTALRRTFASLAVRNFRLYFIGQAISLSGSWMRMVALSWLVLSLTHSGTQLGLITAAQTLPILLLGVFGGVIVDRRDNKRLLVVTQTCLGLLSLVIGLLVVGHAVHLWMLYVIAVMSGLISVVDNPARQTFVVQMVGESMLRNAVTLNSTIMNMARIIGPSIAAVLIATVGIGLCFIIDAGTFAAILIVLFLMKRSELHPVETSPRAPGQLRAGLRYAWSNPTLRITLLMMVIIGTFAYEFPVVLPVFATITLDGNATTYSLLTAAMGLGAIFGGLFSAGRPATKIRELIIVAALFGLSICLAAAMPNLVTALGVLVLVGVLSVLFISMGNTTLQLASAPQMRGRVMSLWSIAFQGTTPIGGPIIGAIIDQSNPRVGLLVGGVAALVAAGLGVFIASLSRRPPHT